MSAQFEHYENDFAAAQKNMPGHGTLWLDTLRRCGLSDFKRLGFPTPRHEDWRYTNVAPITKRLFSIAGTACLGLDEDDIQPFVYPQMECYRLVFVNGRFLRPLSRNKDLPPGVTVENLAATLQEQPGEIEAILAARPAPTGFAALNTAFLSDGARVRIECDTAPDRPIQLLYLSTGQDQSACHSRNIVEVAQGGDVTIIETHASLADGAYLTNVSTDIVLSAGAACEHYKLQEESLKAFHISSVNVRQGANSRFTSHAVSLGAALSRHDIQSVLAEEGASCTLNGLYITRGRQHSDFHTRIDHSSPGCNSDEYYKGILDGRSRAVFNGQVHVHPGAQKSDAMQSNHNLLLSPDAEIDTKPQLEIYADDVKCAHGATVGQLDPDKVFYLKARGIPEELARGLLTYGFVQDVVERMALRPIVDRLENVLVNLLPNTANLRDLQ